MQTLVGAAVGGGLGYAVRGGVGALVGVLLGAAAAFVRTQVTERLRREDDGRERELRELEERNRWDV